MPSSTAILPALFFVFLQHWAAGQLSYDYQDGVFDPGAVRRMLAAPDPLRAFCADTLLWGPLAATPALEQLLRDALAVVKEWLVASTTMPAHSS